jgi:hypothetical protein
VNNRDQNISNKCNGNEESIINGIPDKQISHKVETIIRSLETSNISLDLFNNSLISSLFIRPILFGETKPEIISNGFRYDGLSFL